MRKILLILIIVISVQFLNALDFNSTALRGVGINLETLFPNRIVDIYNYPFNFANHNSSDSYFSYMQIWEGVQISTFQAVNKPNYNIGIFMNLSYEMNDHTFPHGFIYSPDKHYFSWIQSYSSDSAWNDDQNEYYTKIDDNNTIETYDDLIITEKSNGIYYEKYNNTGFNFDLKILLSKPENNHSVSFINFNILRSFDPKNGLHYAYYEHITEPVEDNLLYPYVYKKNIYTLLSDCESNKFKLSIGNSVNNPISNGSYSFNYSFNFLSWKENSKYYDSYEIYSINRFQSDKLYYDFEQNYYEEKYNTFGYGSTFQFIKEKQLKHAKSVFMTFFDISRLTSYKYEKVNLSDVTFGFTRGFYFAPTSFSSAAIALKADMNILKRNRDNYFVNGEIRSGNIITPIGVELNFTDKLKIRFGWAYHFFSCHTYDLDGSDYNFGLSYKFNNSKIDLAVNKEMSFSKPLLSFSFEKGF